MFHSTFIRKVGKGLSVWAFLFLMAAQAFGQIGVTVTNPTNTTPNLAASYLSLTAAVADLNLVTAMSGPVTLTLDAGTSETAPIKGFNISTATAGVLNATNTLTIVKAVGAATVINAGVGTANGPAASPDGILYLNGSDYVTIDGITFTDGNSASATVAMEFGIALFKRTVGDGCNNNTIQNCIFNLQRVNNGNGAGPMTDGSCAIQVLNSTPAAATTALTPTNGGTLATNGTNSNNRFYNNQINNGNSGIHLGGFAATVGVGPAPVATTFLGDINNDIGGAAAGTGNTILNYGGGAATNPAVGIRANNQWSVNIRYNTIDNNDGGGVNHANTLRGIFAQAGTSANATISNNTITVRSGATTSALTAIENVIGSTAAANTININSNTIRFSYTTATTGVFTGVVNSSTAATVNINSNNIQQLAATSYPTTGTLLGISGGAPATLNTNNNTISNFNLTSAAGGTMRAIVAGTTTTQWTATGNTIENLSYSTVGSTGSIDGIYNFASAQAINISSNIIRNFSTPTTGTLQGIYVFTSSGTQKNCNNNQVYNFSTSAGGAGGASMNGIRWAVGPIEISGNEVYNLNSTGTTGGTVGASNGIWVSGGSTAINTIFNNRIYNITSTSTGTIISGIQISGGTPGTNIYNNLVGLLNAPAANADNSVRGINLAAATATSTISVFHNTVYMAASSSGTNFGSSGIFHTISTTATTSSLDLRNNIIYNNSTPSGTGLTVAFRRSGGAANNLANYASTSNNNLFYAGSPGASNLIYADGTSSAQTIALYKAGSFTAGTIAPRDGNSVSESITFQSLVGNNANFLKYPTGPAMLAEQGGQILAGVTTDFSGVTTRCPNGGCPGGASVPDMGAWELNGTPGGCSLFPTATITPAGALNYCSPNGTPVAMTGSGSGGNGGPYTTTWSPTTQLWTNAGASIAYTALANVANVWATPATSTTYTLTVTDGAGCTSTATKTINISTGVTLPALTNSGPICPGSTATLTSNASVATTIAGYGFATSSGSYTPISSGTVLLGNSASTFDDNQSGAVALPFTFNLAGINYTHFNACVNGWMRLGTNASVSSTNPTSMSSTLTNALGNALNTQLLAPMWDDLYILGNSSDKVHYSVTGTSPNQVFTVEWFNVKRNLSGGVAQNFQVKLFENGNVVQFVYGACTAPSGTSASCGITDNVGGAGRFLSVNDFTLAATASSAVATDNITGTAALVGLTFTFTPAPSTLSYAWIASGPPADNADFDDQTIAVPTVGPLGGVGSYPYQLTVTNTGNGCTAVRTTSVVVSVAALNVNVPLSNNSSICAGAGTNVTLTGTNRISGGCPPYDYEWIATPGGVIGTGSVPTAGSVNTIVVSPTVNTTYTLRVMDDGGSDVTSAGVTVNVTNPSVLTANAATRCGIGTTQLTGTVNPGDAIRWYDALTGGNAIGSGSPVTSPVISSTTTFYAAASTPGGSPINTTIGAGVTTGSAAGYNPFYHLWGGYRTQFIFTAAELNAAGITGGDINSIALDVTTVGATLNSFAISIGTTGQSVATTTAINTGLITKYTNPAQSMVLGFNTFTFSSPYYWDGVTNLVINFCWSNNNTGGTSNAVRYSASGFTSTMAIYDDNETAAAICAATNATDGITGFSATSTNRANVRFNHVPSCEGTRVPVVATVNPPPALTVSADQVVCNNVTTPLSVVTGGASFNTYIWAPQTNLFTDAGATIPYTGTSATTVYAKTTTVGTTTYTLTGTQTGGAQCVNNDEVDFTNQPLPTGVNPSLANICVSGSVTMNLSPATGYAPGTLQWQTGATIPLLADIGGANASSYTTPVISSGTPFYRIIVKNGAGATCTQFTIPFTVNNPQVLATTPATRCGQGTVNLSANVNAGSTVAWYTSATGGSSVGTGSPFATPTISATTSYYAAAVGNPYTFSLGLPDNTVGTYSASTASDWPIRFLTTKATTIKTVVVYPTVAGNLFVALRASGSSVDIANLGPFTLQAADIGNPVTLTLDISVPTPGDYQLTGLGTGPGRIGRMSALVGTPYPFNSPDGSVSLYGSATTSGTAVGSHSTTTYNSFFNIVFESACESGRTEVVATVTPAPAISANASPATICAGAPSILSASSGNAGYTYTWQPGAMVGPTQSVTPASTTVYTLNAQDNSGGPNNGCFNTTQIQLNVNPVPSAASVNVTPPGLVCGGVIKTLAATANTSATLSFGTQASTNTASTAAAGYPGPYTVFYGGQRMQMLIRANELTSAGFVTGSQLTSIAFTVVSIGANNPSNISFQMNIGHSALSALATNGFQSGLTNVVAPATYTATIGLNTHTFSSPFVWNGVDNVIVETTFGNSIVGGANDLIATYYSPTSYVSTIVYRGDGATNGSPAFCAAATNTSFTYSARPDFTLNGTLGNTSITWTPIANLFTDAGATVPYVSATNFPTVYAKMNAITNVNARVTLSSTGCFSDAPVSLLYTPRPKVDISANEFVCEDQDAPVNFFFTGTGPWDMTYNIGGPPVNLTGITSSPIDIPYLNATVDRTYTVTALSDATGCTSLPEDLAVRTLIVPDPCEISWNGSQNNQDWFDANNWTPNNSAPSQYTSVKIPGWVTSQPNITGNAFAANVNLFSSPLPAIAPGGILNIKGDLMGGFGSTVAGQGKIIFNGTGLQNITGRVTLSNVEFGNSSTQGVVIAPNAVLRINPTTANGTGLVTILNNSKTTNNGKFILASNATATAKIGPTPATFTFTGDITQERWLPYTGGVGTWNFIASPFSGRNFTNWVDNFKVVGLNTGFGPQGAGIINSNEPERSTIFEYDEPNHHIRFDTVQKQGWKIPGNVNIIPGKGYRVWVDHFSNGTHKFDNEGTLVFGDFNFPTLNRTEAPACIPASFPCDEPSLRGWNLVANPYPCDIDWDAPSPAVWTKPIQMSNAWYRWHAEVNNYGLYASGVYVGSLPEPANPNLIPSSQSFFVRLAIGGTYNATLAVKEAAKSTGQSGQFVRTNVANEKVKIILTKPGSTYGFSTLVRFMEGATDGYDFDYDFTAMNGSNYSVGVPVDNQFMGIASYAPIAEYKVIPLSIRYNGNFGSFILKFKEMASLLENNQVFLRDNMTNALMPVTEGFEFAYFTTSTDPMLGNRFDLIFNPEAITATINPVSTKLAMTLFPNPNMAGKATTISMVGFETAKVNIRITDALGRGVFQVTVPVKAEGVTEYQLTENLASGIYTVQTSGGNQTLIQKLVVK